jgi:PAS domain S-box-containing protein
MTSKNKASSRPRKTKSNREDAPPAATPDTERAEETLREYQAILSAAEEVAKIGSWRWDLRTQKLTWSDEMFRLFGMEREGFDGNLDRVVAERIHPDDVAAVNESNRNVLEGKSPIPMSYRIVLPDGTERTVWAQGKLVLDANGQPKALTGFTQDITERVRAEKKVLQMKRLYATLSQVNQMIVRVKQRDELFQTICDVAVEFGELLVAWIGILDEPKGDVVPRAARGLDLDHWTLPIVNIRGGEYENGFLSDALKTGQVKTSNNVQPDARTRSLHAMTRELGYRSFACVPFRLRGKTIGVLNLISSEAGFFEAEEEVRLLDEMGLDISFALDTMRNEEEHKRAEEKLRENEERLRLSLEAANQGLYDLNVQTGDAIVNRQYAEMLGYDFETFVETNAFWIERLHPDDQDITAQAYRDYIRGLLPEYRVEFRQRTKNGDWKWILSLGKVVEYDAQGNPLRMLGTHTDITKRKLAEEALKQSEENLSKAFSSSPAALLLTRLSDGRFLEVNDAYCKIVGYERHELLGRNTTEFSIFIHPSDRQAIVAQLLAKGSVRDFETSIRHRSGEIRNVVAAQELITINGEACILSHLLDITARKTAEDALQLANARFERMVDSNIVGIVVAEANGKIVLANDYYLNLLNLTRQDLMDGKVDWRKFTPQEWLLADEKAIQQLRENGVCDPYEKEYVRADGSRVSVLIADALFAGPEEQIIGLILDITERKQAEQARYESESRYRNLIETSPDGIFINRENQIVFMNSRGLEMLGASVPEQILGRSPFEIFHPDSHSLIQERIKLLLGEGVAVPVVEEQLIRLDGTTLSAEVTATPVMVDGVIAIQVVLRDITERKRAEEQVKQNERVLRLFVEHSPASIAMFDREMRYIVASHRYFIDYRLSIQDLTGRSHYDIFPEIPERWKEIHRRGLNGEIIKAEEDPFPREDGTMDWVRWEIHPWYEESGNIGGIILFSEVITERKQVQDELHLLNLQLEQRVLERTLELSQANRAKDEFLANMSHELRTPLNTVLGLSETLLEQHRGPLNEKQVQSIELIASSGRHLLGLINDILEVSKIEAGKLEIHPTRVYIKELCESSLNFVKEIAFKKRIDVKYNQEASLSTLFADPQRLKQILINLLTNAVKFTPDGGHISLDVYTNADRDRIMFAVKDTGIGIADQDLKKLFTPFTQLDSSLSRQYAGTGLGLALVQKLTDLQGGSVEVESETGKGSRFTIILPFNRAEDELIAQGVASRSKMESKLTAITHTDPRPVTVLLAEDNEINAQMIAEYLEAHNYKVFVSQDGEAVLQKASETSPEIILMDIQMPKMDGLESMRHLRADTRFASTPIIALTALAMPGDRERCIQAGANEYLSKPVSLKKLVEIIQNLTGR